MTEKTTEAPTHYTVLEVQALTKSYEELVAVNNLSFQLRAGEIYGLLGPNGAGKSTTIKSILGLLTIDSGTIRVFRYDPMNEPHAVKTKIGYVPEEPALYESLTVKELLEFVASVRGLDPQKASYNAQQYLYSLDAMKYYNSVVASLSRGNKQKVQIIAALIHEPAILILDEPLSGLDARSASILKQLFQIHLEQGGSILLSTHVMEQAQQLCTRIGVINQGRLVAEGSFEELREQAKSVGANLEEIFLQFTEQDASVQDVVNNLRRLSLGQP